MSKTTPKTGTKAHARFVRTLELAYDRAVRAEEDAPTMELAWKLANKTERALRTLQLVRAGLPVPTVEGRKSAAKVAMLALGTLGRAVARAVRAAAGLAKAQAMRASGVAKKAFRSVMTRCVAFYRTESKHFATSAAKTVTFQAPSGATLADLLVLCRAAGVSEGSARSGVFEIQVDAVNPQDTEAGGVWQTPTRECDGIEIHRKLTAKTGTWSTWSQVEACS